MKPKGIIEEVKTLLQQYQLALAPGMYVFAPEVLRGRVTGRIIETRSDHPAPFLNPADLRVTLGFFPLGFVPASLKGAPPSWLSGYPFLPGLDKLAEAPKGFLEQLKRHVEDRMQAMKELGAAHPAEQWPHGEVAAPSEFSN
jgi:hypothetical protein